MSIKKPTRRLQTIPEFLKDHPDITESQLRWALRNRASNGFPQVYVQHGSKALVFNAPDVVEWFAALVPA